MLAAVALVGGECGVTVAARAFIFSPITAAADRPTTLGRECRCVRVPCAYAFYARARPMPATAANIIIIILLLNFVDDSKHDQCDYVSIATLPVRDNDIMFS